MTDNCDISLCNIDFKEISYEETQNDKYHTYTSASHGMIYSKTDKKIFNDINVHANILMQMRSCGNLGFGGGIIDDNETPIFALNREMREEFHIDPTMCLFLHPEDHVCSHVNETKKFICHFYAREIGEDVFYQIERNTFLAEEFGKETFGTLRVPLFIDGAMRGLPLFLSNNFSGNAQQQLVLTLVRRNIIPRELLAKALDLFKNRSIDF